MLAVITHPTFLQMYAREIFQIMINNHLSMQRGKGIADTLGGVGRRQQRLLNRVLEGSAVHRSTGVWSGITTTLECSGLKKAAQKQQWPGEDNYTKTVKV